ncbi:MAG: fibronectin type III domain-containing protein [Acutalibacteraceae bacterium]
MKKLINKTGVRAAAVILLMTVFSACAAVLTFAADGCKHSETIPMAAKSPTCTEPGYTEGVYCLDCDEWISGHEEIAALKHSFGDWTVTQAETCCESGSRYRTCQRCLTVETETISPHGHTEVTDEAVEATCTAEGKTQGKHCSECGKVLEEQKVIPKKDHEMGQWTVVTAPKCESEGKEERHCQNCEYTERNILPPCGHTEVTDEAVEATCTAEGKTQGKHCSECGKVLEEQKVIPKKDHEMGQWTVVTAPKCESEGKEERHCQNCGYKETKDLPPCGHKAVPSRNAAATLSKNGSFGGSVCSVCGKTVKAPKTVARIRRVSLSEKTFTYNGKAQKPKVTVTDSNGKKLKNGTDYTVKYARGCKNVGRYMVTVKFIGKYSGGKTLTFEIKPKGTKIKSLTAGKDRIEVRWKKTGEQISGCEIECSTDKSFGKGKVKKLTVKKGGEASATVRHLKGGKKYYIRIRTYKTVTENGKKVRYYSAWSEKKAVRVKK